LNGSLSVKNVMFAKIQEKFYQKAKVLASNS